MKFTETIDAIEIEQENNRWSTTRMVIPKSVLEKIDWDTATRDEVKGPNSSFIFVPRETCVSIAEESSPYHRRLRVVLSFEALVVLRDLIADMNHISPIGTE